MKKQIYVTNGMARSGKDSFAEILNKYIPTMKYSSIDWVKEIAEECGWDGAKTERDRKFLSDLKMLISEYSNMPFKKVEEKINEFLNNDKYSVLLIDIREPSEIDKVKNAFNAKTILINNDRVKFINSNAGDAGVYDYDYDYMVQNNSTIDVFEENIKSFYESVIKQKINK